MHVTPPHTNSPARWQAYAALALSMSLVGSYVALSKPLVAVFPVFLLAWLRFGIGGLAMWRWLRKPADEPPMTRRTRGLLFLESFLGNFLFSICMLFGVRLTTAVAAGVVMSAIPAVVAILSWLFAFDVINHRNRFVNQIADFLDRLTAPLLEPFRRIIPNLGGIDISPIVVILLLQFISVLFNHY